MDPALIDALTVVSLEAIKILGPAIVTGAGAYLVARAQYKTQLEAAREGSRLKGKEHLLGYYKEKITRIDSYTNNLLVALGHEMGSVISGNNDVIGVEKTIREHVALEVEGVLSDMDKAALSESGEYARLQKYFNEASALKPPTDSKTTFSNLQKLSQIYLFLSRCSYWVLEKKVEGLFKPYIK